jgi:hypothetical protein
VIVHSRSPIRLARTLGFRDSIGFASLIAGTPLTFLLAPVLWVSTIALFVFGADLPVVTHGWVAWVALGDLIAGNVAMIFLCALAAVRDRGWRWAPLALLNPLYWVLHSWASWRALIQLIRNPFLWEKTPHGLHAAEPAQPDGSAQVADDGPDEVAAARQRRRVGVLGAGHQHEVLEPQPQQAG